jgi:monoamine oxidase
VQPDNPDNILDVAIVGGGVSGLYSAWRLSTATVSRSEPLRKMAAGRNNGALRIALYEGSDRIGGRLLSVTPPGMPHVRCELGGMRYVSTQRLVRSLVENKLKLPVRDFVVSRPENLAYLRRRRLRSRDLANPDKIPYDLDWPERGQGPGDLMGYALDQIIPGITKTSGAQLEKLLQQAEFENRPLYDHGFWNLLLRALSTEAYAFALGCSGYDTIGLNWNAVDTILLNFRDFGPQAQYKALVDGFESLPRALYEQFGKEKVHLKHRLQSFDRQRLPDGSDGVVLNIRSPDGKQQSVLARHLILAMPRRSLELLDQTGAVLDPPDEGQKARIRKLIRSVTPIPLFKLFLCYERPWWEAVGVKEGQSVTDLPVQQCYYWAVEGRQPGADPANTNAAILATYDDTLNVGYWDGLTDLAPEKLLSYAPGSNAFADQELAAAGVARAASRDWTRWKAPIAMVEEAQRELKEMHGLRYVPDCYEAVYRDWGDDPFGGGVNFWNIHEKSWEVIPSMIHPALGVPVYVCGEAYSGSQGWVEGALETAELMLQTCFGLAEPDWVKD